MKRIKFVGLDVHAETIAVAVAERGSENARDHSESIRKLVKKLGPVEQLRFCLKVRIAKSRSPYQRWHNQAEVHGPCLESARSSEPW
jgi:hypothetical protein